MSTVRLTCDLRHESALNMPNMRRRRRARKLAQPGTGPADGPQTCMGAPRRAHTQPWRFRVAYGVTMARVTTLPPSRPSHSAVSKASLILVMGNLWEMTLVSGYFSLVRMRNSMALGMIQGS